ncbi:MAG: hypothetical protein IPP19_10680 [Verrucomicrobia bacterium]|nr:hypothetical protein [Verrucomicrobiota bacterium]
MAAKLASGSRPRFWLRSGARSTAFESMGAKYYPTIKDQKASQRFQQKQNQLQKQKKAAAPLAQPEKAEKKK